MSFNLNDLVAGAEVRYVGTGLYDFQRDQADKVLKRGEVYTIKNVYISVGEPEISLEGVHGTFGISLFLPKSKNLVAIFQEEKTVLEDGTVAWRADIDRVEVQAIEPEVSVSEVPKPTKTGKKKKSVEVVADVATADPVVDGVADLATPQEPEVDGYTEDK